MHSLAVLISVWNGDTEEFGHHGWGHKSHCIATDVLVSFSHMHPQTQILKHASDEFPICIFPMK